MQHFQDERKPADRGGAISIILAINGVIVLALVAIALSAPSASEWISAAAQAEFVDGTMPVAVPMQTARPTEQIRTTSND
jgi:hypothetical protein